ncbi:protein of unknown function [Cupriavidus taiwanensis]|uniref:Uncharacterized protein n=1 Tax=Cupriavidus taiwanensis TaxID=164546 RepID=A0A375DGK7_9BURK|nr:protein of unknown function [Cupriavidus taiwanensis]SOZ00878.1 hypothetical protein CBM2595_A20084 [Cupriavidus taiwanensis]SOZ03818.1 hypothetical protein CBM2597_A40087 [Cupriavidus taiwanensis]SPC08500.1 hypothetical protein CBM2594_A30086 [Cupriavidus taiwanensis]SPC08582.1 hypothetical protein CT19431_210009 [Cupriavidus taiwanensis]
MAKAAAPVSFDGRDAVQGASENRIKTIGIRIRKQSPKNRSVRHERRARGRHCLMSACAGLP